MSHDKNGRRAERGSLGMFLYIFVGPAAWAVETVTRRLFGRGPR